MLFKGGALADVIARPTTALWPSSDLRHAPVLLAGDAEVVEEEYMMSGSYTRP